MHDTLLPRLEQVRRVGAGYVALCPAHDDHDPSLSIDPGRSQPFVLRCRSAQCEPVDILAAVGLTWANVCTPQERPEKPRVVAEYTYRDESGEPLYVVKRYEPGFDGKPKSFAQYRPDGRKGIKGVRRVLYRLPDVLAAVQAGRRVWVVEGEKDADRLAQLGEVATCNSGGTGNPWPAEFAEWFRGADVVIVADNDDAGRKHARHVRDLLAPVAKSVSVVRAAIEREKADVSDHLAAGHDLAELVPVDLDAGDTRPAADRPADVADTDGTSDKGRGPSQAAILVKIARDRFDLFMSDDGRPYAVAKDGPNIARPLRGKAGLRALLAKIYADEQGGAVPAQSALTDAMTVLEGVAQAAEPRTPHLRVARDGERVVVDLGTTDGRCVVVGPDGWERCPRSPVLFRRSGAMKSLPDPVSDGDGLARLGELLNVDTDSFRLLVAWLAAAFIPDLPHPILAFRGEQGTGKSKSAQMVIGIIDPSGAPKRTAPRDVKSWATQAFNSWGLCLDNVSYIPDWLSDALCRAVTGDGIVDRALYTDDDVVVLEFRRVLALTTIDAGALAGDLAERLLTIELSLIKDTERREEAELDRAFADAHAAILASLFDLLAQVLKVLPDVRLTERPRMADFARVLAAVDHITGWETLKHYKDGARNAVADVLEGEPFAQAVVKLVDQAGEDGVTATAQQILELVDTPDRLPKKWPKDATRAGGQLKRLAPALRTIGVEVTESRNKHGRFWTLTATDERRKRQGKGREIEGANDRHQRHPEGSTAGMTSGNRGDASSVTAASPLPGVGGPGDAGDATGDAETFVASPARTPSDQAQRVSGDAGDGGDAEMRSLSQNGTDLLGPGTLGDTGTEEAVW
ncbi:hypothetical protein ABZ801_16020 [Actinomadura sp. NPDC047616]|uniref:hypothetical protein n=1 Tax=Actinomadura sp. NPDC047616 TaxID=3155914 RepID=UPI0033FD07F3